MKLTKTLMALGIVSATVMSLTACQQSQRENPLLQESELPFGAPDFSKIQVDDYLPAFEVAIQQSRGVESCSTASVVHSSLWQKPTRHPRLVRLRRR